MKWHVFESTIDGLGRKVATCDLKSDAAVIAFVLTAKEAELAAAGVGDGRDPQRYVARSDADLEAYVHYLTM